MNSKNLWSCDRHRSEVFSLGSLILIRIRTILFLNLFMKNLWHLPSKTTVQIIRILFVSSKNPLFCKCGVKKSPGTEITYLFSCFGSNPSFMLHFLSETPFVQELQTTESWVVLFYLIVHSKSGPTVPIPHFFISVRIVSICLKKPQSLFILPSSHTKEKRSKKNLIKLPILFLFLFIFRNLDRFYICRFTDWLLWRKTTCFNIFFMRIQRIHTP